MYAVNGSGEGWEDWEDGVTGDTDVNGTDEED